MVLEPRSMTEDENVKIKNLKVTILGLENADQRIHLPEEVTRTLG